MLPWITRSALAGPELSSPHGDASEPAAPSRLLVHLAGEFAEDVARVWPAPHADFVLAETSRRHLVCAALAVLREADVSPGPGFVAAALDGPLKRAIPAVLPDAPPGLARALDHLGEAPWSSADYRLLLTRLGEPAAAKRLRHAVVITAERVRSLSALPPAVLLRGGVLLDLSECQARLVRVSLDVVQRRGDETAVARAVRDWSAAPTAKALFERIQRDIEPSAAEPFHPGTARLKPLATRDALVDAARRYANCLRTRMLDARSHYYEWAGPPGVIVEVGADPVWGWILEEGRMAHNAVVPADLQAEIAGELEGMGVHVGRTAWNLRYALETACNEDFDFSDEASFRHWAFGD